MNFFSHHRILAGADFGLFCPVLSCVVFSCLLLSHVPFDIGMGGGAGGRIYLISPGAFAWHKEILK